MRCSLLGSCLRSLLRGLIALGQLSGYAPPVAPPPPAGPGPGHPERLRPDLPLSDVERELRRQLRDISGGPVPRDF
ncbi:DUF6059 family protein [Kitasatospora sp. NPDC059811]|uniref:DUF6059 family protein n=1 Tax=Streptomycetaceae TaxID=2062 RepID=UPI0007AF905B|nr:DUF6059 family protein [Streptomyces sp. MJM8645]